MQMLLFCSLCRCLSTWAMKAVILFILVREGTPNWNKYGDDLWIAQWGFWEIYTIVLWGQQFLSGHTEWSNWCVVSDECEKSTVCPMPSRCTVVNPGQSKCTDWYLWFNVYMVFSSTKVANIGPQGKRVLVVFFLLFFFLSVVDIIRQIIIRTAQQWQIIGAFLWLRTDIANLISLVDKICSSYKWNILLTKETSNASKLSSNLQCMWFKYRLPMFFFVFFPDLVTGSGVSNIKFLKHIPNQPIILTLWPSVNDSCHLGPLLLTDMLSTLIPAGISNNVPCSTVGKSGNW